MTGQADRVAPAGTVLVTGDELAEAVASVRGCLLYTSPSPRDS